MSKQSQTLPPEQLQPLLVDIFARFFRRHAARMGHGASLQQSDQAQQETQSFLNGFVLIAIASPIGWAMLQALSAVPPGY